MPRIPFLILALCAFLSLVALPTSAAAPETPESLAAMKAQLAQLKAQTAALEAKIAAAEAPAAGTEPGLVTALNAMPKNLWPDDSDSEMKKTLREKWLAENIKPGTAYTFTGTISVVSPTTINAPGKPPVDAVSVVLDCGKHLVWGKEKGLRVIAVLSNVAQQDTLDWNDKKTITITGPAKDCRVASNPVEAWMDICKMK